MVNLKFYWQETSARALGYQKFVNPTFSMLTVSCRLFTRKCAGNPWIPSTGIVTAFWQLGHTITLGLLLPFVLALVHLSKHSSQNEWRQGSARGFLKGSRHIPQWRKFWFIFSAREVAIENRKMILPCTHKPDKPCYLYSMPSSVENEQVCD